MKKAVVVVTPMEKMDAAASLREMVFCCFVEGDKLSAEADSKQSEAVRKAAKNFIVDNIISICCE